MRHQTEVKVATAAAELSAAQEIRRRVFVDEQGIPRRLDCDGKDEQADHVLVLSGGTPVATGRLLVGPPGRGVLARIAVLLEARGRGLGQLVIQRLEGLAQEQGVRELTLEPHRYLQGFYEHLGYHVIPGTSMVGNHELITMKKIIA